MKIDEIISSKGQVSVTMTTEDLQALAASVAAETRKQFDAELKRANDEEYLTREETAQRLSTSLTSLWRWAKSGYLVPVHLGGKRLYKLSDVQRRLNGKEATNEA